MKHILFLIIATILLFSCKKDPTPIVEPSPYWGESSATINGVPWAAQPTAFVNLIYGNNWHIIMNYFDQNNILREGLNLIKVPFKVGTYPVVNGDAQLNDSLLGADFTYWIDDQTDGYYTVLESDSSSFVSLTSYDTTTKELRGTFTITFIAVHKPPYPGATDTLRVRNGVFHTRVRDK